MKAARQKFGGCPGCSHYPLEPCTYEGNKLSVCPRCGGLWCETAEWDESSLGPRPELPGEDDDIQFIEVVGRPCPGPGCGVGMTEVRIRGVTGLSIDVCGNCHGAWFDKGEWQHLQAVRTWQQALPRLERRTTWAEWFFQFFLRLPVEFNIPPRRWPIVTLLIVAACVVVQVIQHFVGAEEVTATLATRGVETFTLYGAPTLITHQFVHGGWLHLLPNMYLLYVLGDNVEDVLGRVGFLFFYLFCGIVAASTHIAVAEMVGIQLPLVGASGAIAGVIAAYLLLFRRARLTFMLIVWQLKPRAAVWIVIWLVLQIAAAWIDPSGAMTGVAWTAHVGGFVCGFIIILPLRRWLVSRHALLDLLERHKLSPHLAR